MIVWLIRIVDN